MIHQLRRIVLPQGLMNEWPKERRDEVKRVQIAPGEVKKPKSVHTNLQILDHLTHRKIASRHNAPFFDL